TAKALTGDEVRAVVTDEIGRYKLTVTRAEINQIARTAAAMVPKPKDGVSPTDAEIRFRVAAAVAAFCLDDKCVKQGADGKPGATGKDAPKATDEELLKAAQQALATFCAADSKPCAGTDGVNGQDGQSGADGRGIADTDCLPDGTWRISYTDGTTSIVRGPCRVVAVDPQTN
ncbi:MAG TPA: hypothetical protein VIQ30_05980, partial [Pseudonocardia sp.]